MSWAHVIDTDPGGRLQSGLLELGLHSVKGFMPGVSSLSALTFKPAIDDHARFSSSKAVGVHFGLTPKKYQSGETDVTGAISKVGDVMARGALYEAAQ